MRKPIATPQHLRGWKQIAASLGQPVAIAQRWAKDGMPVRRSGRYVAASAEELSQWLAREMGLEEPIRIAVAGERDLALELKRGLKAARRRPRQRAA